MCRLLGVVSGETSPFGFGLHDAPRSLLALSPDHPDGWGLAVYGRASGWQIHRHTACAGQDARFREVASGARGELLIGHIRRKTVGDTRLDNTHPFQRGRWVFAHNGTVGDVGELAAGTSDARRAEVRGDTDSERLFAYLLTAIDRGGGDRASAERALVDAVRRAQRLARIGIINFLLSDGEVLYAHRLGRTLHVLERGFEPSGRPGRRRRALWVASEAPTEEPFREVPEGALLALRAGAAPSVEPLIAA